MTKKLKQNLILMITILMIFNLSIFSFATSNQELVSEGEPVKSHQISPSSMLGKGDGQVGNEQMTNTVVSTFQIIRNNVLPFIPILLVIGAVIYFLIGVRSKEKRKKGIGLMIIGIVLYLILQLVPLVIELVDLKAFDGLELTAYGITYTILKELQLISLPIVAFCIVTGYIISNTIGARNMQKKRIGDTMVISSIIFLVITNVTVLLYPLIFSQVK